MTTQQITDLLQRYEQAATTDAEEAQLRQMAQEQKLPDDWNAYFNALDNAIEMPDGMERHLEQRIDAMHASERARRRHWWGRVAGIAATVAILLGVGQMAYQRHRTEVILNEDTYSDPQLAYEETEQVLTMLSQQLNKSDQGMKALQEMSEIMNKK